MNAPAVASSGHVKVLRKCHVTITTRHGPTTYVGLFQSTCDAVLDAIDRMGLVPCKVRVEALL